MTVRSVSEIDWNARLAPYRERSDWQGAWCVLNSVVPLFALVWLGGVLLEYSVVLTLLTGVIAGGFISRTFVMQHDCGHGSLFRTRWLNLPVGIVLGVITATAHVAWMRFHSRHHSITCNLDRRHLVRDVPLVTVGEYLAMPRWKQIAYRVSRIRFMSVVVLPLLILFVARRAATATPRASGSERLSVMFNNVAIPVLWILGCWVFGTQPFLLTFVPALCVGTCIGGFIIFTQHHFENTYWSRHESWDFYAASLQGSAFLDLPPVLRFLTGNIGYHHLHHLCPTMPNYNLKRCHDAIPELHDVPTLSLAGAWRALTFTLWDESQEKMISFRELQQRQRAESTCETLGAAAH